jgi:hypothetical protein
MRSLKDIRAEAWPIIGGSIRSVTGLYEALLEKAEALECEALAASGAVSDDAFHTAQEIGESIVAPFLIAAHARKLAAEVLLYYIDTVELLAEHGEFMVQHIMGNHEALYCVPAKNWDDAEKYVSEHYSELELVRVISLSDDGEDYA